MVNSRNAYLQTQVLTARPEQLTLKLFDGAIRFGERARAALAEQNFDASFNALTRAEQIVMELLNSLKPDTAGELCRQQAALYMFVYSKLVEANMHRAEAPLADALRVLGILRATWVELIHKLQDEDDADGAAPHAAARTAESKVYVQG